jgi:hypothetical protein
MNFVMNKKYYFIRLVPRRADFAQTMSEEERSIMMRHVDYWREHMNCSTCLLNRVSSMAVQEALLGILSTARAILKLHNDIYSMKNLPGLHDEADKLFKT